MSKFVWCFGSYGSTKKKVELMFNRSTLWGLFTSKERAFNLAKSDFWNEEGYYTIGIVEKIPLNSIPHSRESYWFYYSYKHKKIRQIKKPKSYNNVCGFTVG